MSADKEIRSDAKLKNLPEDKLEELWQCRYPEDEDAVKLSYDEILVALPDMVGYSVSRSTLGEFYAWLRQKRRMDAARQRSEQAKLRFMQDMPDASPEELERLGQMVFTSETVEEGNIKGFVALMRANNTKKKLQIEERRIHLLEERARKADEAEGVLKDGAVNGEEKQARLKQIFGIS